MKNLEQYINEHIIKGHLKKPAKYIDLDLPSGTMWATCNIGADNPEDYGLLFQWGRTDGYKYNDKNNVFLNEKNFQTTSGTNYKNGDTLKPEDDAAYQATNGELRMPTVDELQELLKYTNEEYNAEGIKYISKKDKSKWIFIPYAGYFAGSFNGINSEGHIWTSSIGSNGAYRFNFTSPGKYSNHLNSSHTHGFSVRGVLNK